MSVHNDYEEQKYEEHPIPPAHWKPRYLTLSGGGAKGCGHSGSLIVLESWGYLTDIKGIVCTSVGSVVGAMWLLGFTPSEIATMSVETQVNAFKSKLELLKNLKKGYLTDGKWLRDLVINAISQKIENVDKFTLRDAFEYCGKILVICTVRREDGKICYLSHENEPELPLVKALEMSSALPLFVKPVEWKGYTYWDGGILDNYPITYFPGDQTLGIRLLAEKSSFKFNEMLGITPPKGTKGDRDSGPVDEISKYLNGLCQFADTLFEVFFVLGQELENQKMANNKSAKFYQILVDTKDISVFQFELENQQRVRLVAKGIQAALKFVIAHSRVAKSMIK